MAPIDFRPAERLFGWIRSPAGHFAVLVFLVVRLGLTVWMWGVRPVFSQCSQDLRFNQTQFNSSRLGLLLCAQFAIWEWVG
jgi:hypothetical protein